MALKNNIDSVMWWHYGGEGSGDSEWQRETRLGGADGERERERGVTN